MAASSGLRGFSSGRRGLRIGVAVLTALVVFVACFMVWHYLMGDTLREVDVVEARLVSPKRLELFVAACYPPQVSLWERDVDLQVKAVSVSPSPKGGVHCRASVEFDLAKPLGDRDIVDQHTGQVVNVATAR